MKKGKCRFQQTHRCGRGRKEEKNHGSFPEFMNDDKGKELFKIGVCKLPPTQCYTSILEFTEGKFLRKRLVGLVTEVRNREIK